MSADVRIGIAGACGRMGREIAAVIGATEGASIGAVWEHANHDQVGCPYALAPSLTVGSGADSSAGQVDVVIDFTAPEATVLHAQWSSQHNIPIVIGTTGLEPEHHQCLDTAAEQVPMVQAPNMSVGVNVLCKLVADATRMLANDFDIEIVESHHRHKVDAPSGTAMRLLEEVQTAQQGLEPVFERHGSIGARGNNDVGMQTLRGGDVVGEHTVFYFGTGERIELTHRATDRSIFARGAVRAALWLVSRPAGRYTMADVLAG